MLCQASTQRCCRFATRCREAFNLFIHFFLGGIKFLSGGDTVHDQLGLHVIHRAVPLAFPQRCPIQIHAPGIHSLRCQLPDHALQPRIHLAFRQRVGNREIVLLDQRLQNLFAGFRALPLFARRFQFFADLHAQLGHGGYAVGFSGQILGELIVEFGQLLFFDPHHFRRVGIGLSH